MFSVYIVFLNFSYFLKSLKTLFSGESEEVAKQQQQATIQPYYAVFKVPPSQIQSCFNGWAKSLWFAPSEFMSAIKFTQVQGKKCFLEKNVSMRGELFQTNSH